MPTNESLERVLRGVMTCDLIDYRDPPTCAGCDAEVTNSIHGIHINHDEDCPVLEARTMIRRLEAKRCSKIH